jgi:uncharacterized membrane protein YphA (DoxX/SURF4 family)
MHVHVPARLCALLLWPFTSRLAGPLWLALRIYLGSVWLQFGLAKLRGGWLTTDAMTPMLRAIGDGQTPAPLEFYREVAWLLVDVGAGPVISATLPLAELAVAAAFLSGVWVVPAAGVAILLNANLILSGVASWSFDGRIIALQLLMLLGWRVVGHLGVEHYLARSSSRVTTRPRAPQRSRVRDSSSSPSPQVASRTARVR